MFSRNQRLILGTFLAFNSLLFSMSASKQNPGDVEIVNKFTDKTVTYRKFNVIDEQGKVLRTEPIKDTQKTMPLWAKNVSIQEYDWPANAHKEPYFDKIIPYVLPPKEGSGEPFYSHNHQPDITWLPNGDLIAIWYTTNEERGTELTVLASRLRAGNTEWDGSCEFFKADNRNMHGNSIFFDSRTGILHHFNGMSMDGQRGWDTLALLHRYSLDNGKTWSPARPVSSGQNYQRRHQVIAGMARTNDGTLIQPCDAAPSAQGQTAIHISTDGGYTWNDHGGDIRGIHAAVEALSNGTIIAFGRAMDIGGLAPISTSADMGKTWTYSQSEFPEIGGGQRSVLMKLKEGALLLVSFTEKSSKAGLKPVRGMEFVDSSGKKYTGYGMYAAISYDEGKSWPVRKLLTPGSGTYNGGAWTGEFTASPTRAEHAGYLAATQSPDGTIHLISSRLHYRFNLKWLQTPAPAQ